MASCQTTRWVSTSPYVKLTVTQSSSDGDSAVLSWVLQYVASSAASTSTARAYTVKLAGSTVKEGTFAIDGKTGTHTIASGTKEIAKGTSAKSIAFSVSFAFNLTWSGSYKGTSSASGNISVAAKTSYAIKYNANGGTGAPSAQTKWYGTTLKLSSAKPTRTGYTFQGWGTSASATTASYAAGANYTSNAAVTLYAVWKANTFTVSYNANGGSGAPSSQTKTYGVALTLSNTKPTRTNYTFKGWGTSASATTVTYAAGASYTSNASITLYAIWELSYVKPKISSLNISRCNESGTVEDEGECALIKFNWSSSQDVSSITIAWGDGSTTANASGKSGSVSQVIAGPFDTENSYTFTVTVADGNGSTDRSATMSSTEYHIDFSKHSVAIGKTAETLYKEDNAIDDTFDVDWRAKFRNHVCVGDKLYYHDGNQGIFLSWEGFMHLQRTTAQGYHPYIGFYLDDKTEADGMIRINSSTKLMEFLNAAGYKLNNATYINGNIMVGNKTGYHDGQTGVYINKAGYMHLQRSSSDGNPYIGFYKDTATTAGAQIVLDRTTDYLDFSNAGRYVFDSAVVSEGNIWTNGNIRMSADGYDSSVGVSLSTYWADNAVHDILARNADGLQTYVGWSGAASDKTYASVLNLRSQTIKYANSSGTSTLSDERLKKDFTALDKWEAFYRDLKPCAFRLKAGNSGRYHMGFKAQDVEKSLIDNGLTTNDFAGFVKSKYVVDEDDPTSTAVHEEAGISNGDDEYGLIYSEFTALNTYYIQKLEKRVEELEALVKRLSDYIEENIPSDRSEEVTS